MVVVVLLQPYQEPELNFCTIYRETLQLPSPKKHYNMTTATSKQFTISSSLKSTTTTSSPPITTFTITSSCSTSAKVSKCLNILYPADHTKTTTNAPETSTTTTINNANNTTKPTFPVIALTSAHPSSASRTISIAEIVKRKIEDGYGYEDVQNKVGKDSDNDGDKNKDVSGGIQEYRNGNTGGERGYWWQYTKLTSILVPWPEPAKKRQRQNKSTTNESKSSRDQQKRKSDQAKGKDITHEPSTKRQKFNHEAPQNGVDQATEMSNDDMQTEVEKKQDNDTNKAEKTKGDVEEDLDINDDDGSIYGVLSPLNPTEDDDDGSIYGVLSPTQSQSNNHDNDFNNEKNDDDDDDEEDEEQEFSFLESTAIPNLPTKPSTATTTTRTKITIGEEREKVRALPVLTIYLSRCRNAEFARLYG